MCKGAGSNSFDMHYLLKKLEDIFLLHVATSLAIANPLNIQTMPVKWFACFFIGKKIKGNHFWISDILVAVFEDKRNRSKVSAQLFTAISINIVLCSHIRAIIFLRPLPGIGIHITFFVMVKMMIYVKQIFKCMIE